MSRWKVKPCGRIFEQLQTYEQALVEIGKPFSGVGPNLQQIARDALTKANPPARLSELFVPSNPASRQDG